MRWPIREAGGQRFRPIVLTSLTTFVGLAPLMFERSMQAMFLVPMAASLAFGVLFATFITLILVPTALDAPGPRSPTPFLSDRRVVEQERVT